MIKQESRSKRRWSRRRRIRAKVSGTQTCPRFSVFRSLRHLSVQVIDDRQGKTLVAADLRETGSKTKNTVAGAEALGLLIADKCKRAGIKEGVFDRSGYRYHGKVKMIAETLRKQGIRL